MDCERLKHCLLEPPGDAARHRPVFLSVKGCFTVEFAYEATLQKPCQVHVSAVTETLSLMTAQGKRAQHRVDL